MTLDIRGSVALGGKKAEEMAEANRPNLDFDKILWFKLGDKEAIIIRFLDDHDEWPSVLQHNFVPTKPAPDDATDQVKKNWPAKFGTVCRKTPQFVQFFPDGCYICDHMTGNAGTKTGRYYPQPRVWARAVQREEVRIKDRADLEKYANKVAESPDGTAIYDRSIGDVLGYRDVEVEVDEVVDGKATGNKIRKKKILVINQSLSIFFSPLQGYADVYGTVLDRDYFIKRKGDDQKTDYDIVPMNPITRPDGSIVDMREPEVVDDKPTGRRRRDAYLDDAPDLFKLIEDRLDDEVYHRFFDHRYAAPPQKSGSNGSGGGAQAQAQSEPAGSSDDSAAAEATRQRLADMRARVRGDNPTSAGSASAAGQGDAPSKHVSGPVDFSG
jgi:hypothetical protein